MLENNNKEAYNTFINSEKDIEKSIQFYLDTIKNISA
jgi:hypothetical protein